MCFIIAVLLLSCKGKSGSKNMLSSSYRTYEDSLKATLIGQWGDLDNPAWDIRIDSIYYFEESTAYPYKIVNNDLIIDYSKSFTVLRNIYVTKDTLFFLDDQGILTKGYRFKNKK